MCQRRAGVVIQIVVAWTDGVFGDDDASLVVVVAC